MKGPPGTHLSESLNTATPQARQQAAEMASSKAAAERTILQRLGDFARAAVGAVVDFGRAIPPAIDAYLLWREMNKEAKAVKSYNAVREKFRDGPCFECEGLTSTEQNEAARQRENARIAGERARRIQNRQKLIAEAHRQGEPGLSQAAAQLAEDMESVELARLSADTYRGWPEDPGGSTHLPPAPPAPWQVPDDDELKRLDIDKALLKKAKARVYQLPASFPGGPKTVLAFRGTVFQDSTDLIANHDQAMALDTSQYGAARELGRKLGRAQKKGLIENAKVTGHSLGGGKAQVAAITGGLDGEMQNASGPHPERLPHKSMKAAAGRLKQHRSSDDPLTGLQNSPEAQRRIMTALPALLRLGKTRYLRGKVDEHFVEGDADRANLFSRVLGESSGTGVDPKSTPERAMDNKKKHGFYIPPAVGEVKTVEPVNSKGGKVGKLDFLGQHGIANMINGFEQRKYDSIQTLRQAQGNPGRPSDYIAGQTAQSS